jgi:hypothetical protein
MRGGAARTMMTSVWARYAAAVTMVVLAVGVLPRALWPGSFCLGFALAIVISEGMIPRRSILSAAFYKLLALRRLSATAICRKKVR